MDKRFSSAGHRVVLIVSTGRTGTMALAHHLDAVYPTVRAVHEPTPTRWQLRRAANRYMCGVMAPGRLAEMLRRHGVRTLRATPEQVYVESNPALAGFLEVFGEVFEDFRVVHVVRDVRTYIRSALNWGVFRGVRGMLGSYVPYWLPKPEYMSAPESPPWWQMSPHDRLAWHWRFINTHLDGGKALYGDRYLRVRFEDLFARDGSGLARLSAWLGFPPSDRLVMAASGEKVNASLADAVPRWEELEEDIRRKVLNHCGPMMARYGYDVTEAGGVKRPGETAIDAAA